MNNCLLCANCDSEGGYEEGYYGYSCSERELHNDNKFPYKKTKCKLYKNDFCIANLSNKKISKKLWESIDWEVF